MSRFPAEGYIELAETLASVEHEPSMRSATSRAYYGIYHIALEYLESTDAVFGTDYPHYEVWNAISGVDRKLGRIGFRCRDNRRHADYDAVVENVGELAAMTIADVKALKSRIEALPGHQSHR